MALHMLLQVSRLSERSATLLANIEFTAFGFIISIIIMFTDLHLQKK